MAYRCFGGARTAIRPSNRGEAADGISSYMLVIGSAVPIAIVAALMIFLISRERPIQQSASGASPSSQTPSAIAGSDQLQMTATLQYWRNLNSALPHFAADVENDTAAQALRNSAANIESLNCLNVDQEALNLGATYCKDLRDIADRCEYLSSPQFLGDCFMQGAQNGDVLWGSRTSQDVETIVKQDVYEMQEQRTAVRQLLSQRYSVEFDQ